MTTLQILQLFVPELSQTLSLISLYASIAMALVLCFFGYRLQRAWFTALVFGISALLGFVISAQFLSDRLWLCLLIGLGCGVLISLFAYRLYQAAAFVVAFSSVFSAVGAVLVGANPTVSLIVAIVLGLMAGILAAKFQYKAVIIVTSVFNGWKAAMLLRQCIPTMDAMLALTLAAVLMSAGMIFQFAASGKKGRK